MATPVTTIINGYTFIATLDVNYGTVKYVVNNPDGSELFYANGASSVYGGLGNLAKKAEAAGDTTLADTLKQTQIDFNNQSASIDQAAIAANPPPPPVETAASDVKSSPDGTTQNPAPATTTAPTAPATTTASTAPTATEPVRTLTDTQNVPQVKSPQAGGAGGVGASNEDSGTQKRTSNNTPATVVSSPTFADKVTPRPNILGNYASYTYSLSWYLLPPDAYINLIKSQKKSVTGFQLLAQSGGIPMNSSRNEFFNLDYYIDGLELDTLMPGKATKMANSATSLKFTITEPNGITLLDNLYRAVAKLYSGTSGKFSATGVPNYAAAQYLLAIRFYGYDDQGKLVQVGRDGKNSTDSRAVVEKFYPFIIQNVKFRIASKLAEYEISGIPIGHGTAFSSNRGVIPAPIELTGTTVNDILSGGSSPTTNAAAADGRNTKPIPNTTPGVDPNTFPADYTGF